MSTEIQGLAGGYDAAWAAHDLDAIVATYYRRYGVQPSRGQRASQGTRCDA